MKTYKWFIIIVAVISVLGFTLNGVCLELFIRNVLIPKDNWYAVYTKMLPQKDLSAMRIIALGDSRASRSLDINKKSFFNFSFDSENSFKMYMKLNYFLNHGLKPQVILLQADYHVFTRYRAKDVTYEHYQVFLTDDIVREFDSKKTSIKIKGSVNQNYSMLERYLFQFREEYAPFVCDRFWKYVGKGFTIDTARDITEHGAILSNEHFDTQRPELRMDISVKRARAKLPAPLEMPTAYLVDYYEKTLRLCKECGAQVVLVRYPVSAEYRSALDENRIAMVNKVYDRIQSTYKVPLWDYTSAFDNPSLFADPDHVNKKGAGILSAMVLEKMYKENVLPEEQ
jgi:hypothetical protein